MTVTAENRAEDAVLVPSRVQLLISRVARIAKRGPAVAADVGRPVRNAGKREIQARRNLSRECLKGAVDIARPHCRRVSLLAQKSRAGQNKDALLVSARAPVLVYAPGVQQRKNVGVTSAIAQEQFLVKEHSIAPAVKNLRFRTVQPEAIPALFQNRRYQRLPVGISRSWVGRVIVISTGDRETTPLKLLEVGGLRIHHRPHGNDGVHVFLVQFAQRARNIGVRLQVGCRVLRIALALPPKPVLDNGVEGHVRSPVFGRYIQQLLRGFVAILRLEESVSPLPEQRSVPGQVAVLMDELIHLWAVKEVVVDRISRVRRELQLRRKSIVEPGTRSCVPENRRSIR